MNAHTPTPMLDRVQLPADCRAMSVEELKQLADDLRRETIDSVAVTGGHLGAGLGVVELTVALHHVFNTPHDKLIWDVGHQAYPHKILTGRRDRMRTIRQGGGLSGFCKRDESEYDAFGAGHSSTSISAGLGMAVARDLKQAESRVECRVSSEDGEAGSVHSPLAGESKFPNSVSRYAMADEKGISVGERGLVRDLSALPLPSPPRKGEGTTEQGSPPSFDSYDVVCVIGDGAMSAGMAYEAMNNAGALGTRLIVILNDNDMSIAPPTGAMSAYLSRLISSKSYRSLRHIGKMVASKFPAPLQRMAKSTEHHLRTYATGGTLFEALGFYYVGPVDGHNLDQLLPVLKNVRDEKNSGPVLVHVVTKKGHGYAPAEQSDDKYHGVVKFDVKTGAQAKSAAKPSYTSVFAKALIAEAEADDKILAITAAMPSGTGIDAFMEKFPERAFDVGIAEQHAVTFAAGLAVEGYKPFCAIYSTFLQRAYDQVIHDVAIQNLPVRFAIDRAGLVGADGATHAGAFDLAYLCTLPNFVVMAAADGVELMDMVATCAAYNDGPIAVRYPRGNTANAEALAERGVPLKIGRGRVLRNGANVALLSLGTRLEECLKAAEQLAALGINATVADARFAKPLDEKLIAQLIKNHPLLITVEEGAAGGFGAHVLSFAANAGLLDDGRCAMRALTLPDDFQAHDTPEKMLDEAGLNAAQIVEKIVALVKPAVVTTNAA